MSAFWKLIFAAAIALAAIMASLPQPPVVPGNPSDKLLHFAAFVILTLLARIAFPQTRAWTIFLGLGAFGAGIEIVQSLPEIGRDASLSDWLVDLAAIALTLGVSHTALRRSGWS